MANVQRRPDLPKRLQSMETRLNTLETATPLSSSSAGEGGIRIYDGGSLAIEDGGDLNVQGGDITASDGGDVIIGDGGRLVIENENGLEEIIGDGSDGTLTFNGGGSVIRMSSFSQISFKDIDGNYTNTVGVANQSNALAMITEESPLFLQTSDEYGVRIEGGGVSITGLDPSFPNGGVQLFAGNVGTPRGSLDLTATAFFVLLESDGEIQLRTDDDSAELYLTATEGRVVAPQLRLGGGIGTNTHILINQTADIVQFISGASDSEKFRVGEEGLRLFGTPTTANAANVFLASGTSAVLHRSTSSARYKQDIDDATIDPEKILAMRPRTWRDRTEVAEDPDTEHRYVGFIAEELAEIGLDEFVTYDDEGPESIAYDRLGVGLLAVLKQQQQQIEALTARIIIMEEAQNG